MPPRAGKAAVEIVGDVNNFGSSVERELNNELRGVKLDVRHVADDLADGVNRGVEDAKQSLGGLPPAAKESLGALGEEADRAGDQIGAGVRKGTNQARDELGRFIAEGEKTKRGFSAKFGSLPNLLGGIGKAAGMALSIGIKTAAVAGAAQAVTGLLVALAPAVGAVGPLVAAFAAVKIASGTLKLALMGVSDALGAALTGDTAAFTEALKAMPPAAQTALKEIAGLKDQILGVRTAVQGQFFMPLIGQLKPLGALYLPMVTKQLAGIAAGFGRAAASTAGFLRLPSSVTSVNNSLGNTREAINNVSAGVPGIIRAFLPLWEVGSSFLPGLTGGFDDLTQRIGKFMEEAQKSGKLEEFFSNGLSVLGELGTLLGQIGSIIGSVFQAASAGGGSFLGVIGQAVEKFATFLNSAEGMSALTSVFQILGQVAGIFGQALQIVLPIIGQLVTVLAGALAPILPVISNAIRQLAPIIATVGQALGGMLGPAISAIVSLLAALIPALMPVIQSLVSALLPVVLALAPVITTLGQAIGTVLLAALSALMPVFTQLLPVLSELLVAVLLPLIPVIVQLANSFVAMMPAIAPVVQLVVTLLVMALKPLIAILPTVIGFIATLLGWFMKMNAPLNAVIGTVARFLTKLLESEQAKAIVVGAWNAIKSVTVSAFNTVKNNIINAWNTIRSGTMAALNAVRGVVMGAWNAIKSATSGAFRAVVSYITGNWNTAKSVLRSISGVISQVIGFFGRMREGIASKVSSAIGVVRGIPGKIKGALGNLGRLLYSAGANVINGLINGISSKLGALRAKAASAASTIRNLFPFSPAKEGPLSGSGSPEIAGRKIATMLASGMKRGIPELREAARRNADMLSRATKGDKFRNAADEARRKAEQARKLRDLLVAGGDKSTGTGGGSGGGSDVGGGGSGSTVTFMAGSIVLNFYGVTPSNGQAYEAGKYAARGLVESLQGRDVRTTVRTI